MTNVTANKVKNKSDKKTIRLLENSPITFGEYFLYGNIKIPFRTSSSVYSTRFIRNIKVINRVPASG